jgi:hypothetical protein
MMPILNRLALAALCLGMISLPAHADTDLTGLWSGQFNGIQIEIPPERGPFGYVRDDSKTAQPPRYVDKLLQLNIESQSKGLVSGTWTSAEFKKRFVCAQTSPTAWNCIDAGGRGTVEVTSPTELRLCYFDNREAAQGAGCATLRRAK